ncbi:PLP-dependent cysteine synthase family protein [Thermaerobacillus caldiproteolyticus]|uniref:PLP-dependent cysteine synthase family protein n=1 Tax=Thermaerobacillus caldiproteolyticus TaxID=247480 RepID=UPI00188CB1C5|nr:cysteine synthase family protein [Anoxybacillus caldiproteolyticus]QPA32546.1 cysteine synthase family protein [Anoxybacillus caldiproteolyticus]
MVIYNNITECIGCTPVVSLNDKLIPKGKKLYLKLEYFNPNFSVKDRTALGLVKAALLEGRLKPGGVLIESTSGNLGKSLSMLGAVYKFKVIIVVDPKISPSLLRWYRAYGAEIEMVTEPDKNGGYQTSRIKRVQELLEKYPDAYWPNQYDNPHNPSYHFETTGHEVLNLPIDSVVGAVSTGGHLCGIGKLIKHQNKDIQVIACDVKGSAVFNNCFSPYLINGVGLSWRSKNTDLSVIDKIGIASDQEAISICHMLAKDHGIMIGGSGGLSVFIALSWLRNSDSRATLAIIPDTGINYLDQIYDHDWLESQEIEIMSREDLNKAINERKFITASDLQTKERNSRTSVTS